MLNPNWIPSWRIQEAYGLTDNDISSLETELQHKDDVKLHESWFIHYQQEFANTFKEGIEEEASGIQEDEDYLKQRQEEIEDAEKNPEKEILIAKNIQDAIKLKSQWENLPAKSQPAIILAPEGQTINHQQYLEMLQKQYQESADLLRERKEFFSYRQNLCQLMAALCKSATGDLKGLKQTLFFNVLEAAAKAHVDRDLIINIAKITYDEQFENKIDDSSFNQYFQNVPPEAYNASHPDFDQNGEAQQLQEQYSIFIRNIYDLPSPPNDPRFIVTGTGMVCGSFDGEVFIRTEVTFIEKLISDSFCYKKDSAVKYLNRCGYFLTKEVKGLTQALVDSILKTTDQQQSVTTEKTDHPFSRNPHLLR